MVKASLAGSIHARKTCVQAQPDL